MSVHFYTPNCLAIENLDSSCPVSATSLLCFLPLFPTLYDLKIQLTSHSLLRLALKCFLPLSLLLPSGREGRSRGLACSLQQAHKNKLEHEFVRYLRNGNPNPKILNSELMDNKYFFTLAIKKPDLYVASPLSSFPLEEREEAGGWPATLSPPSLWRRGEKSSEVEQGVERGQLILQHLVDKHNI